MVVGDDIYRALVGVDAVKLNTVRSLSYTTHSHSALTYANMALRRSEQNKVSDRLRKHIARVSFDVCDRRLRLLI